MDSKECSKCKGSGGFIDLTTNVFSPCACLEQTRKQYVLSNSGIPKKYWTRNFQDEFPSYVKLAKGFWNSKERIKKDHLIIGSTISYLKTDFLALLCKGLIFKNKIDAVYINFNDLLVSINQLWEDRTKLEILSNKLKHCELLCVNNLDTKLLKENMNSLIIANILAYREENRLSTFISSDYSKENICNFFSISPDYFTDLIVKTANERKSETIT